ncbi:hypothetical protein M8C13_36205 [Crossiella sp. SN42]|uniref:hypothetical protein n=1 Tax=Crossiella sp. SN42 TaxID=2944808 RepID=UPI00207CB4D3|nr:hypothetical protein [Crossiella sp. SN42]MCO1581207.1 hypothetical protein [Crossiella sp. SN42]
MKHEPSQPATAALAEGVAARLDASPAAQRDAEQLAEFTLALAAADSCWSANLGDPPSDPDYIRDLAADVWRLWVRPALAKREHELAAARQHREGDLAYLFGELDRRDDEIDFRRAEWADPDGTAPAASEIPTKPRKDADPRC